MQREEYLTYRNKGSGEPLFYYYTERCKDNCLSMGDFFQTIQRWPNVMEAYEVVTSHYDVEFTVMKVPLKDGKILYL